MSVGELGLVAVGGIVGGGDSVVSGSLTPVGLGLGGRRRLFS